VLRASGGISAAGLPLRAHLFAFRLASLRVGLTKGPHALVTLLSLGTPRLALLGILLTPGTALRMSGLALLAFLRIFLAPRLHSRPPFLETGFDFLAPIGFLCAALFDTLLVVPILFVGQNRERDGHRAD
jgi:hypothetical protein